MTVSEHLAEYVLSLNSTAIADDVRRIAKTYFIDSMACMFLGTDSDSVKKVLPMVRKHGKGKCVFPGEASLLTDSASCAMLCAMSAHSNDFDDISASLNGHPSALIVPVIFSAAQDLGTNGEQMLTAYIAGVEIDSILGSAFSELGCGKGINPTNFIGIFGAVAAAGIILGLDREQLADAFGIAVNEASGFKANFGTLSKDLAIGMTAAKAIISTECAFLGIDASRDAFEGDFGLFESICGRVNPQRLHELIDSHKSEFIAPGLVMKPYPSCRGNHSGIDCITKIMEKHNFAMQDVQRVICRMDKAAYDTDRYKCPNNPGEAKFSLAFCIAKVISCGKVSVEDFTGDTINDTALLDFIDKVDIVCMPELFQTSRYGTEMEVRLLDGSVFTEKECFAKGDPNLPMTEDEVRMKLETCLSRVLPNERLDDMVSLLTNFDKLDSVRDILDFFTESR